MRTSTHSLTTGKISTTLLQFSLPFLIASFMQALYGAADLFVVGRFNDSATVSAVAIGSQIMQTVTGIILGISMGGTVLVGRRIGEKNHEGAAKAIGSTSVLFMLISVILVPLMLLCIKPAVHIMETPPEAIEATLRYLFICTCGVPFIIGYNAVSGIFRGIGDSKSPMYFITVACIINIVADFLFVGGLGMGASGAALATILSQGISFFISLFFIRLKGFPFLFHKKHFRPDKGSVLYILKVGSPLALQDALVNVSFLAITAIINTMGLIASASVGIVEKVIVFAMLPPTAFASAVAAMSAQNIGAGNPHRATSVLKWGISFSLVFGVLFCAYAQFDPETITAIFSSDQKVIETGALYLKSYSIDCILVAFIFCINGYLSGCGKSMISFVHSMIATFGVRIPISYFLSKVAGISLYEIGFASPLASLVSIIICCLYFYSINMKKPIEKVRQ